MKRYTMRITIDEVIVVDNLHQAFDVAATLYPAYSSIEWVDDTGDAADAADAADDSNSNSNSNSNYGIYFNEEDN